MKSLFIAFLAAGTCLATIVSAAPYQVREVAPTLQTPILTEADMDADADDPAIYANAADPARSVVITAVKNGGMRVYSLKGELVQTIPPSREDGRINNVDLVYGFTLDSGEKVDLAIGSDRGLDIIRVWRIDMAAAQPLTEVTDPAEPRAFPSRPSGTKAVSRTIRSTTRTRSMVWQPGRIVTRARPMSSVPSAISRPLASSCSRHCQAKRWRCDWSAR